MDEELAEIIQAIENAITHTMISLVQPCKMMFATYAGNEVLSAYKPTEYTRRSEEGSYNGTYGVADEKSYEITVEGTSMTIESTVQGNPRYAGTDGWDSGNITDIIEGGSGYHWRHSEIYRRQPVPRPWMDKAGDDFADNMLMPMVDAAIMNILGG